MGEHSAPQSPRTRPVPGPLPPPIELPVITRPPETGGQRLLRRPRRWARRTTRALRTRQGKWVLVALACAAVVLVGLLGQGFLSSPGPSPSVSAPAAAGGAGLSTAPASPAASPSRKAKPTATATGLTSDPLKTLRAQFPDNPLNHLRGPGLHDVVISATSAADIAVVGYLVPTGLGAPYGTAKPHSHTWSNAQQAIGRGYLAAVFVQTGRSGTPITCRIVVDGKVTNTETTSGAYGRAVCLG